MLEKVVGDKTTAYTYNEANQLVSETIQEKTIEYIYNQNGDLVEKSSGEKYTYDIQGNLTSVKGNGIDQSFTYNGNGNRLSKTVDGETTYFVNDLNQSYEQVLQTYNDEGVIDTYTYGVQRIQSVGETTETYLYNGRGSVVGAIGADNEFASYSYTAYGDLMPSSPEPKVFGFNAEATDFETGMQYLRARYYDVGISRFIQEDDYRGDFVEPLTMHRYSYVGNNPINRIDPSGYGWLSNALNKATVAKNNVSSVIRDSINKHTNKIKESIEAAKTAVRAMETQISETFMSTEEYLKLKDEGKDIDSNIVIKPEYLIQGLAGYLNGAYCNDGGEQLKDELISGGKTPEEADAIVDTKFEEMSEDEVNERNAMMDDAYEYINYTWTPTETLKGWKHRSGNTYYAGVTYRGLPYSQDNRLTPEAFDKTLSESDFYDNSNKSYDKYMPNYGQDCSGLFSDVWGNVNEDGSISNLSTLNIIGIIGVEEEFHKNITKRETSIEILRVGDYHKVNFSPSDVSSEKSDELIQYYDQAAPGDAVVKRIGDKGHVMIVVANNGDTVTVIEQTEPTTQLTTYTYKELASDQYMPITKKNIDD